MKFILHSYRRCPFCIRPRILMYLKGIEHEIVEEPFKVWTAWLQDWAVANNERKRVPVLEYHEADGTMRALPESHDINLYLDALDGNPVYTPVRESTAFADMQSWREWCDENFKHKIDLFKYGKGEEFDVDRNIEHTNTLRVCMQKLEDRLLGRDYLVEDRITLADIAIIPFVRQIMRTRNGEYDFTDFPQTVRWANSVLKTDWFENIVMKRYSRAEAGV